MSAKVVRAPVTGGAGFIGLHRCERLLGQGYSLACVDDLSTGGKANTEHLLDRDDFHFVQHDISRQCRRGEKFSQFDLSGVPNSVPARSHPQGEWPPVQVREAARRPGDLSSLVAESGDCATLLQWRAHRSELEEIVVRHGVGMPGWRLARTPQHDGQRAGFREPDWSRPQEPMVSTLKSAGRHG